MYFFYIYVFIQKTGNGGGGTTAKNNNLVFLQKYINILKSRQLLEKQNDIR